jgi:hypothetical protein
MATAAAIARQARTKAAITLPLSPFSMGCAVDFIRNSYSLLWLQFNLFGAFDPALLPELRNAIHQIGSMKPLS